MKFSIKSFSLAVGMAASFCALAAVPDGYYSSLEGKSGVELKKAVKALADGHTVIHYGDDTEGNAFAPAAIGTWTVFLDSDVREIHGEPTWWDMYSSLNLRVKDGHNALNIEHSVPNSWWGHLTNAAYKDLHHLNPSNPTANNQKGNNPLGLVDKASWENGVSTIGTPVAGLGGGSKSVFEPDDVYKGDFARAYFYIFTTYDDIAWDQDKYAYMYDLTSNLTLQKWAYDMLLDWAKADPVSYKEMDRNDAIYKHQNNRNPFIDCPQLADHIWGSKQNEPFHYALYTPADDDPDYPGWDQDPVEMIEGQWQPVTSDDSLSEDVTYILCSPVASNRIMSYNLVDKKNALAECLYSPSRLKTYPEIITSIPVDAAIVKLVKSGNVWVLAVYDSDDDFKGYLTYKTGGNYTELKSTVDAMKAPVEISLEDERTLITFPNYAEFQLMYNANAQRFSAYKGTMAAVQLYRPADKLYEDPEEPEITDPEEGAGIGSTGLEDNGGEVIIGIFDLNGRQINASTTIGLEKGIYIVVTNHGTKKIRR